MKSTFFYKERPHHVGEIEIDADRIDFRDGWVIFLETVQTGLIEIVDMPITHDRIIQAIHSESCHNLREILNDD